MITWIIATGIVLGVIAVFIACVGIFAWAENHKSEWPMAVLITLVFTSLGLFVLGLFVYMTHELITR